MGSFLLAQLRLPARGVEWMRAIPERTPRQETAARLGKTAPERPPTEPYGEEVPLPHAVRARPATRPATKRLVKGRLKHTRHPLVIATPKATRAYRRTFRILMNRPEVTDRYDEIILKYAAMYDLDPRLLKSIISAESEFNRKARSPAGARGLMQLMPRTAESMGVPRGRLNDPEQNIKAGAAYLAHLYGRVWKRYKLKGVRHKDAPVWVVQRVIAAYHAGPRFLFRDRWFRSTRLYVRKVLLFYQSGVTDVRRAPLARTHAPEFGLVRSSNGFFN